MRNTVFLLTAALVFTTGCGETKAVHYETAASASQHGAFDRGWLPKVLSPDATDIEESHDLDSNHGEATFHARAQTVKRIEQTCTLLPIADPSPFIPKILPAATAQYKCGEFSISFNPSGERGYIWH